MGDDDSGPEDVEDDEDLECEKPILLISVRYWRKSPPKGVGSLGEGGGVGDCGDYVGEMRFRTSLSRFTEI